MKLTEEQRDRLWEKLTEAQARRGYLMPEELELQRVLSSEHAWWEEASVWKARCSYWNDEHSKETERADRLQEQLNQAIEVLKQLYQWYTPNHFCHCRDCTNGRKIRDFLATLSQEGEKP